MTRPLSCLGALLLAACLTVTVKAAEYTDDMAVLESNHIKYYSNLAPIPMDSPYWDFLPDSTVFSFADRIHPIGFAQYRVTGAKRVYVSLYTQTGTCVTTHPFDAQRYLLGDLPQTGGQVAPNPQAKIAGDLSAIYTQIDGIHHRMEFRSPFYEFIPTQNAPANLMGYGINVFQSTDGQHYTPCTLHRTRLWHGMDTPYVYEQYSTNLLPSTKYVRIAINDITHIPMDSGVQIPKERFKFTALASVTIQGDRLELGEPEPQDSWLLQPAQPQQPSSQSPASQSSSDKKESSSQPSSPRASSAASPSTAAPRSKNSSKAPSAPAPKFQGVILPSQRPSRNTASQPSSSRAPASAPSSAPSDPPEPAQSAVSQPAVYQLDDPTPEDRRFSRWLTVYVVVLATATVAAAILPRSKSPQPEKEKDVPPDPSQL